ncbi:hypothetical protein N8071_00445 [bacterium]|nr:hypothetical protein [bacterium]
MAQRLNIEKLIREFEIPHNDIVEAAKKWRNSNELIVDGILSESKDQSIKFSEFSEIRDRYISIIRYCDDAEIILNYHSTINSAIAGDEDHDILIYAMDPHIITAYAEFDNLNNHNGFSFFSSEKDLVTLEKINVPLFVYAQLLYPGRVSENLNRCILNAGQKEISNTLSYYFSTIKEKKIIGRNYSDAGFVDGLYRAYLEESDASGVRGSRAVLQRAFEKLMFVGGVPHLKQALALARWTHVLKAGNFLSPEQSVRSCVTSEASSQQLSDFSDALRYIRNNPSSIGKARRAFTAAYDAFRTSVNILARHIIDYKTAEANTPLRGGELDDLNAMLEVHIINTCLSHVGLAPRIYYVTLSNRMYDFKRFFDLDVFRVPMLHPRSAIMLHKSSLFEDNQEAMAQILGNAIGFVRAIPSDQRVSKTELDKFEEKLSDALTIIRNTTMHIAADTKDERRVMVEAISKTLDYSKMDESRQAQVRSILDNLEPNLEKQVEDVKANYTSASDRLAKNAWDAYLSFVNEQKTETKINVVVRRYSNHPVHRLTCLPINGAYRYLFVLHNQSIVDLFDSLDGIEDGKQPGSKFKILSIEEFLDQATKKCQEAEKPEGVEPTLFETKKGAMLYYCRAIFAACHGQWTLAHSLATNAIQILDGSTESLDDTSTEEGRSRIRAAQLAQEILFLRHLCRRAIAEQSGPSYRRSNWLDRASKDLNQSSVYTTQIPTELRAFSTKYDPVSIRQALAFIGLQIEILHAGEDREVASKSFSMPETGNQYVVWHDLGLHVERDKISLRMLISTNIELFRRVRQIFELVRIHKEEHSEELWRFLFIRTASMLLTLSAFVDVQNNIDRVELGDDFDIDLVFRERREFDAWIDELLREQAKKIFDEQQFIYTSLPESRNPFLSALLAAYSLSKNATYRAGQKEWVVQNPSEMLGAFASLDVHCNKLDLFGFPRQLVRDVKRKYWSAIRDYLVEIYDK